MLARKLDLWCVLGDQIAVSGPQDPQLADFIFYAGDTYRLRLNGLTPVTETGSLDRYSPAKLNEFTGFEAAIGLLDAPPEAATWKIKHTGGAFSAALPFNISIADLQAAIEGLAEVGAGKVAVTQGNATNVYLIRPTNPDDDFTFEVALSLVPLCTPLIRKGTDGSGSFTFLKLAKGYFAWAPDWVFPMPPTCEIAVQRTGSTLANCIFLLTIPDGAVGSLDFTWLGTATRVLAIGELNPAAVEAALNELFSDGATAPRFRCFQAGTNGIQIECIGALAKMAVDALGLDLYGQVALDTPEAHFAITNLPIEIAVAAKPEVTLVFEVVGVDGDGEAHRLLHRTCRVINTLIDAQASAAIGVAATRYTTVYVSTAEGGGAEIIGQRSASVIAPGIGTLPGPGSYETNFTHGLNTLWPVVDVFELLAVSPESWRQCADTEFDARTDGNPLSVTVTFPFTPPEPGNVGARKIIATNRDAQAWINDHRHPTDAIDGVGIDAGRTLTQIIAVLRGMVAALTGDLPGIPGNLILPGTIDAAALNLTSLINALFTPTGAGYTSTLTSLREVVKDPTLISNLITTLTSNPALATVFSNFINSQLTVMQTLPAFATAIKTAITGDPALSQFFAALVLATLQDGATIKDAVIFTVPDFALNFPNPDSANDELPNGDVDGFFPLPSAIFTTLVNDGNITGRLPNPTSSLKGHLRTVLGNAFTLWRDFTDGQIVYCTGFDWFPGVLDTGKMFTTDGDATLFTLAVNDKMLATGTRFSFLGGLSLQQLGNCEGRWLLKLERCSIGTESGPGNIATLTVVDTILSQQIVMDDTAIIHNFGFAASRTALALCVTNATTTVTCPSTAALSVGMAVSGAGVPSGAVIASITNGTTFVLSAAATTSTTQTLTLFAATQTLYTVTGAAVAPTSANFVLRARLCRYDTENVAEPRGVIKAGMKGVRASIAKI